MNHLNDGQCRLCAEIKPHNNLTNLQTDEEMCGRIVNKLTRFNIIMDFKENSILPKTVCLLCIKYLEQAFTFVTEVEKAQALYFNFIQVKEKDDLDDKNIFYEPPDGNKEVMKVKIEHSLDSEMYNENERDRDNADRNVNEVCNDEHKRNIINDDSGSNGSGEENNVDIKPSVYSSSIVDSEELTNDENSEEYIKNNINTPSNVIIKDKIDHIDLNNKKNGMIMLRDPIDNCKNSLDINVTEITNLKETKPAYVHSKIKKRKLLKKKVCNEPAYSEDYIKKQINRRGAVPLSSIKMTWEDWMWKCSFCETLFSNVEELQKHAMEYHSSCHPYQCTECNRKKLRLQRFLRHVRTHRKWFHYSCYKCFKKFRTVTETTHHRQSIHEDSDYICGGCNTAFYSESELRNHTKKFYKNHWRLNPEKEKPSLTCSVCKKVCKSVAGLRSHFARHTDRKREYTCEVCGKCFFSYPILRDHMVTHGDMSYPCEVCKHSFRTIYQLRSHASLHSGVKPYTCDNCGKCFRNKKNLINHMVIHSDSLPYSCSVCNKKFRFKNNHKNHMLQHTGVKPYACDVCLRTFTNLSNRNKHMRRRHGIEMAKRRLTSNGTLLTASATGEADFPDVDKMNQWKQNMLDHKNAEKPRGNKKIGKVKAGHKEKK